MKYIEMILVGLGLTYLAVFGNIKINGDNQSIKGIYYDNFKYTDNVEFYGSDGLNIQYSGELSIPGDYYELTFDVVNSTGVDVEIADCFHQEPDEYIDFRLTYEDGQEVEVGDTLKSGETKRLTYKVTYQKGIDTDDYEFDSSFSIHYEQL